MKKNMAVLLSSAMIMSAVLAGCSSNSGSTTTQTSAPETEAAAEGETEAAAEGETEAAEEAVDLAALTYAVEAGSAGEAAADDNGWSKNVVSSQADALMEVAAGKSDAAIIDLLMAGAMIGEGTSYPDLVYTDKLTTEEYGVGCRQDSDLTAFINAVLYEAQEDGTLLAVAEEYGVQESLVEQPESVYEASEDGDVAAIQSKGVLVVGITDFAPMDYKDDAGEWIGFDADMARVVAEKLGVEVQFVEIDWDTKTLELSSGKIDCVWNGMTLTNEVMSSMNCTNAYCNNAQVVVIPAN